MKNKYLEDRIQGIGLLGVMGSLIFVGLQVKQADEVGIMDVLDGTAERGHELSTLIAENANVWYRACLGEELTPHPGFREIAFSYRDWSEIGRVFDAIDVEIYRAAVFARFEELQKLEPEPDADVMWCGAQ
jgi:hypothetical protein